MDYPSNSQKDKASSVEKKQDKKIERVVQGDAKRRKKPLGKRFSEVFIRGDASGVWGYISQDVLLPAAKDMLSDAVSQGVEQMLFGQDARGRRPSVRGGSSSGYVSYNKFAPGGQRKNEPPRNSISRRARANHNFDEIVIDTRLEAEEVIDRLFDLVSRYEIASVADLYELVGISGDFTDEKWGWSDLQGAGVSRVREGWLLNLPRPEPLS